MTIGAETLAIHGQDCIHAAIHVNVNCTSYKTVFIFTSKFDFLEHPKPQAPKQDVDSYSPEHI
jgi:hypothetical protein